MQFFTKGYYIGLAVAKFLQYFTQAGETYGCRVFERSARGSDRCGIFNPEDANAGVIRAAKVWDRRTRGNHVGAFAKSEVGPEVNDDGLTFFVNRRERNIPLAGRCSFDDFTRASVLHQGQRKARPFSETLREIDCRSVAWPVALSRLVQIGEMALPTAMPTRKRPMGASLFRVSASIASVLVFSPPSRSGQSASQYTMGIGEIQRAPRPCPILVQVQAKQLYSSGVRSSGLVDVDFGRA